MRSKQQSRSTESEGEGAGGGGRNPEGGQLGRSRSRSRSSGPGRSCQLMGGCEGTDWAVGGRVLGRYCQCWRDSWRAAGGLWPCGWVISGG